MSKLKTQKQRKYYMEKESNWSIGDYILYKSSKDFRIAEIIDTNDSLGYTMLSVYDFTIDSVYSESLFFMDKYWTNLGTNKEVVELLWLQKSKQY